ncbi:flavin reductase family protein [Sanyastnella coralliicola]|uniref:flavin reductase family protein n=1 Tax=Sanyastnella coralliicola TaxID=3069118 RepID=UPI0027B9680A|nr:flavin reductase [Longitalea sp. SCSIO 12813]
MKRLLREDIDALDKRFRAALINSLSGFKSANLIGTCDIKGQPNLSVVSSVVHLGSNPPLFGMVMRPPVVPRHTYENILATGSYTINHINVAIAEQAHQTSARYDREESEFDAVGLTPIWRKDFRAPAVEEAKVRMGLQLIRDIDIEENQTRFLVGELKWVEFPESAIAEDGYLNIEDAGTVAISGLDGYHQTNHLGRLSYAKPDKEIVRLQEVMQGF